MPEGKGVPDRLWIFDSVTISNFSLAGRLDILQARYAHHLALTTQVVDEISRGVTSGRHDLEPILALVDNGIFRLLVLTNEERTTFGKLSNNLGQGEASTIAAALHRDATVVTDDRAARQATRDLALSLTGTIGILIACVRDSTVPAATADSVLESMVDAGFYSPVTRISDVL